MNTNNNFEPIKIRKGTVKGIREREKEARKKRALERRIERKARKRDEVTPSIRREVYSKFGDTCYLCGNPGANTIDHVVPLIKGGTNEIKNLRPAHEICNKEKGAKIVILPEELESAGW